MTLFIWLVSLATGSSAGLNAFVFVPPLQADEAADPLLLWRPVNVDKPTFNGALAVEYNTGLVRREAPHAVEELLGDLWTVDLAFAARFHPGFAISISAPVHLAASGASSPHSPVPGDPRLAVMVPLIASGSFEAAVVPFVDIPLGPPQYLLGSGTPCGGALLATSVQRGTFTWTTNFGAMGTPRIRYYDARGGAHLLLGMGAGLTLGRSFGLLAEAHLQPSLNFDRVGLTESPGKVLLGARISEPLGWLTAGGTLGLTPGIGSPLWGLILATGR